MCAVWLTIFVCNADSLQHVLGDYGLVKPVLTDAEGRFLSHAVSVGPAGGQFRRRWRREAASADHAHHEFKGDTLEQLYYNVTVFGREFHLRLRRNTRLVAPGAKMEWQESGGMHSEPLKSDCMYVGDITDIQGASVAISNCDGLVSGHIGLHLCVVSSMSIYFTQSLHEANLFDKNCNHWKETLMKNEQFIFPIFNQHVN